MPSYKVYGLGVQSDIPLPELKSGTSAEPIRIRRGAVRHRVSETKGFRILNGSEIVLYRPNVTKVLVRHGAEMIVDPDRGVSDEELRHYVTSQAMATLLHQRGHLLLHASAVVLNGRAVAFLGAAGGGKSSLAAFLYSIGCPIVTDDIAVVSWNLRPPRLLPGFPQIRIWPDSALSLGYEPKKLAPVYPGWEKRILPAPRGFSLKPVPLSHLVILDQGLTRVLEPLSPQSALIELIRHSYCASLLPEQKQEASHLKKIAVLLRTVPALRLKNPCALSDLPQAAQYLQESIAHAG